ncbi:hypothetical protein [Nocardia vaccinii]|uniref:hypothetical protein n=1 Tax=Nocardia vaccinii TaxID=1822 RepID=UPI001FDF167A|nr:hypothetical protein [Nocardia vaccinii]
MQRHVRLALEGDPVALLRRPVGHQIVRHASEMFDGQRGLAAVNEHTEPYCADHTRGNSIDGYLESPRSGGHMPVSAHLLDPKAERVGQ